MASNECVEIQYDIIGINLFCVRYCKRRQRSQQLHRRAVGLPYEKNDDRAVPNERQFFVRVPRLFVVQRRVVIIE